MPGASVTFASVPDNGAPVQGYSALWRATYALRKSAYAIVAAESPRWTVPDVHRVPVNPMLETTPTSPVRAELVHVTAEPARTPKFAAEFSDGAVAASPGEELHRSAAKRTRKSHRVVSRVGKIVLIMEDLRSRTGRT